MTGVELITQERKEQIEKHKFDLSFDQDYGYGELLMAAQFCIFPKRKRLWPWKDRAIGSYFMKNIERKPRLEQLVVAAALIAAEIDRLQSKSS